MDPTPTSQVEPGCSLFDRHSPCTCRGFTGPDSAGHNPDDDLTQYPIRWDYIFEGTHTTAGGFVDTLKFNIGRPASPDAGTTMRVFSLSRIHGALGDNGQNYKNIKYMIENHEAKIVLGCGA